MKAFAKLWDESQGYNKLGSDATLIIDGNSRGSQSSFYRKIIREVGDRTARVEIYYSDRIYGKPDAVEYVADGAVMNRGERTIHEAYVAEFARMR